MRILILASWYPSKENPIRGSFFREQALMLKKAGNEVVVGTVDTVQTDLKRRNQVNRIVTEVDEGIRTYRFTQYSWGCYHRYRLLNHFDIDYFFKRTSRGYRKLLNHIRDAEHTFDIVHCHSVFPAGYSAVKYREILNVPVVITEHSSDIIMRPAFSKRWSLGLKYAVNNSDAFICVSRFLESAVRSYVDTKKEILVIPNLLSPLFYMDKSVEKYDRFTFASVGGLIPRKGMIELVKCFSEAFKRDESVQLLIVGEGEQRGEIERIIAETDASNIRLTGRLTREKTAECLKKSHAFVLNSKLETFGVVYVEAMACGLPTICTYNGGSDEFIENYGAIGVAVGDDRQLVDTLVKVRNGEIQVDTEAVSKGIMDHCCEDAIVSHLMEVYERCQKSQ